MITALAAVVGPLLQVAGSFVLACVWAAMQHDGVPKWIGSLGELLIGVVGLGIAGYFAACLGEMPWGGAVLVNAVGAAWLLFGLTVGRYFGAGKEDFYFAGHQLAIICFLVFLFR